MVDLLVIIHLCDPMNSLNDLLLWILLFAGSDQITSCRDLVEKKKLKECLFLTFTLLEKSSLSGEDGMRGSRVNGDMDLADAATAAGLAPNRLWHHATCPTHLPPAQCNWWQKQFAIDSLQIEMGMDNCCPRVSSKSAWVESRVNQIFSVPCVFTAEPECLLIGKVNVSLMFLACCKCEEGPSNGSTFHFPNLVLPLKANHDNF